MCLAFPLLGATRCPVVVCVQVYYHTVIPVPVTMLRQSSSRSHRSKRLRPSHSLQAVLLVAVGIWIVYQLAHSYGKRRVVVAVETDGKDAEPSRRRLGRKGFVDDVAGVRDGSDVVGGGADSSDDPLTTAGDGLGDEGDQEADEDDSVDNDADDGLAADEEDDDRDLQSQNGSSEDELKTAQGETQNGLNTSIVPPPVNAADTVQGGVAVRQANATGGAADGTALKNNTSSADMSLQRDSGTAGDVANKLLPNSSSVGTPGAENEVLQSNKNGTADAVAGHAISS